MQRRRVSANGSCTASISCEQVLPSRERTYRAPLHLRTPDWQGNLDPEASRMGEYQVCIPSGTKISVFGLERIQTLLVRWDSGRTGPLNSVSAKVCMKISPSLGTKLDDFRAWRWTDLTDLGRGGAGVRNLLMFKLQIGPFCDLAISKLLCKLCRMILAQPAHHLLELRPINARRRKLTKMLLQPIGFCG